MKPCDRLLLEACELGNEAIKTAFKANSLAVGDPKRWPLTEKMLSINHRLKQIAAEVQAGHGLAMHGKARSGLER